MFETKLERIDGQLTPSERTLLAYIQANRDSIAFESGSSLAEKSGVSPVTVSRFLRRLGYKGGIKGLKEDLRDDIRVQSLFNEAVVERVQAESDTLMSQLNAEIDSLISFWSQLGKPRWQEIVQLVSNADRVFVCGFQTVSGLAEDFANRLALARPNVQFLNLYGGVLGSWIDSESERSCVILVDIAPYAEMGVAFAKDCQDKAVDLVVFTDEYDIARHVSTPHIVTLKTKTGLMLESTGVLTTALNVLLHSVASQCKGQLKRRLEIYHQRVANLKLYRP
ncbi:MurR/RpiR family transcriptional regulator [Pseudomonas aeruginosa]|uniref:MurR/RpiR family transcriptional regulator n=1 Tax=Pseudomonas aeruginosa TaxID=287 RepID=UPI0009372433|nr:MurR/RpiR family transcriptional regulator [Pseudomonas aeruginosa]MCT5519273.1 MurR/RpiR family transcriptional regulator [Pseudomonas aeruginosa]MEE2515629.1 MurR/RpiR family transcriptional regulator [Pseudomonas aeruginosa]HEJ1327410.1 MurR/RpiR family transcriptional regulator [Pseudomonas aeruginosa]